jgi:hypothetical protein
MPPETSMKILTAVLICLDAKTCAPGGASLVPGAHQLRFARRCTSLVRANKSANAPPPEGGWRESDLMHRLASLKPSFRSAATTYSDALHV